jgi:hypothetical protein
MSETAYQITEDVRGQHFGNLHEGPFELAAGEHIPADEVERELLEYLVSIGAAHLAPAAKRTKKEA